MLGLQGGNIDEKLKVFNLKLDTEQKLFDSSLKAAQAMFDQTRLRADDVITSAERSRDRLQRIATLVSAFAGVVITILGAFGFKQIWDVSQMAVEVRKVKDEAVQGQTESKQAQEAIKQAQEAIKKAHVEIQTAHTQVAPLAMAMSDLKVHLTEIARGRFMEAVLGGKMADAKREYAALKAWGGGDEVPTAVQGLEQSVFGEKPPKDEVILALIDEMARDSHQLADKSTVVRVYGLRIAYSVLTGQNKSARQPLYRQLREFIEKNPGAKLESSMIPSRVLERIPDDQAEELKSLSKLTTAKI